MSQTGSSGSLGALYHPLHGEQLENPYPFYARARREEPIFYSDEMQAWVVTRYNDILSILNQPDVFSSRDALRPVVRFTPAVFAELSKGYPFVTNVVDSDGAAHTRFRNAVARAFVPSRIKSQVRARPATGRKSKVRIRRMTTAGLGGFNPGMVKSANSITAVTSISSSPVCFAAANSSKLPIPSCQMSWDSFSFFYQALEPDHATGDSPLTWPAPD